jgi:hypothetical protein
MWSLGLIILLMAGYFLVIRFELVNVFVGLVTYLVLLAVFLTVQFVTANRKLKELGLPMEYMKSYRTGVLLRVGGMVLFFLITFGIDGW